MASAASNSASAAEYCELPIASKPRFNLTCAESSAPRTRHSRRLKASSAASRLPRWRCTLPSKERIGASSGWDS